MSAPSINSLQAIKGWLLVYLIWAFWCVAFAFFSYGVEVWSGYKTNPDLLTPISIIFLLVALFYGYYCYMLIQLACKKQGIIFKIRTLIAVSPIFNALLPALLAYILSLELNLDFFTIASNMYSAEIIGSIVGSAIMAVIWFIYFGVSKRVHAIWPAG